MDRASAKRHLNALFAVAPWDSELFIQIRCIDPHRDAPPFARSYRFAEAEELLRVAERFNAAGRHVFVGVNPRFRPGGKNIDVEGVVALPFDYDSIDAAQKAGAKFRSLGLCAGLVVRTGRGAHFYVLLDRYERRVDLAQAVGRTICRFTGSDAVHARSHVMRLPGTMNWKAEVGGVVATLVACDPSRRYSLEQIIAKLDAAGVSIPASQPRVPRPTSRSVSATMPLDGGDLDDDDARRQSQLWSLLPERYQRIADDGVPRGTRSEAVSALARVLLNVGASEDEIVAFFLLRPTGIGEVVMEKGLGWFDRTLAFLQSDLPATKAAPPLSTVLVLGAGKRLYFDRVDLWLRVDDGPFKAEGLRAGLDFASDRARDPWRFFFMAFDETPAPFGDFNAVRRLIGRTARVVLARDTVGLNVTWWWPAMRPHTPELGA